jgi:membrane protein YqaA with SNARE-associated domain
VLAAMIVSGSYNTALLLSVATIGNVLGSTVNCLIGRFLNTRRDAKWFPLSAKVLDRAETSFARWGKWCLLLSWVPIIGDPLTLAAGILRTPLIDFLVIVTLAKAARYVLVALAAQGMLAAWA